MPSPFRGAGWERRGLASARAGRAAAEGAIITLRTGPVRLPPRQGRKVLLSRRGRARPPRALAVAADLLPTSLATKRWKARTRQGKQVLNEGNAGVRGGRSHTPAR